MRAGTGEHRPQPVSDDLTDYASRHTPRDHAARQGWDGRHFEMEKGAQKEDGSQGTPRSSQPNTDRRLRKTAKPQPTQQDGKQVGRSTDGIEESTA